MLAVAMRRVIAFLIPLPTVLAYIKQPRPARKPKMSVRVGVRMTMDVVPVPMQYASVRVAHPADNRSGV
jgi:hypothetical protein